MFIIILTREGGCFFIIRLFKPTLFCIFSIYYKILPYYIYYYCIFIRLSSSAVYSTVFPKRFVTGCD